MSIISIVVILIIVGVVLYLINQYLPMDAKVKQLLNIVVIVALVLWLLFLVLPLAGLGSVRLGS